MLRLASVVVIVASALAIAAPRGGGKVVRVERPRGLKEAPRLCDVHPVSKSGLCVGQPRTGERITLIDTERRAPIGEFRIDGSSEAGDPFVCMGTSPTVFQISGALTLGDSDAISDVGRIIGLRNLPYDPRTRLLQDQRVPGTEEKAELALDVDGDEMVDYMLVRYGCDELGRPLATSDRRFCFDSYLARGGKLVKVHTDNIQICYR